MHYVRSGDVQLACRSWGNKHRPVLVLVHGYPDSSVVWLPLAKLLARDFFVVAYDVRGSGYSSLPRRTCDYRLEHLEEDFGRIIDEYSPNDAVHLVGHDWGSIQSWHFVTSPKLRGRIASFTSISGPSLDHVAYGLRAQLKNRKPEELTGLIRQTLKSWYIGFFHVPFAAPLLWQLGLDRLWPGILEHQEGIQDTGFDPNRRKEGKSGISLYRANILPRMLSPEPRYAKSPVQIILPTKDRFVTEELYKDVEQWVPELRFRKIDAGHWVQLSHPQETAALIQDFIADVSKRQRKH